MKYICTICGYIYDDEKEKVKFDELPDSWTCPLCGAPKSAFKQMEEENKKELNINKVEENIKENNVEEENEVIEEFDEDMQKLTTGQLSAICSNLARGCEKQYKFEEEKLFKEIATYLEKVTPSEEKNNIEDLQESIKNDIAKNFVTANKVANEEGDRGAKRALTWSEKVTKMTDSLLNMYKEQGEEMFKDKEIWICTVCGFIYLGEKVPERCPVCKVPSFKFKKVEGRMEI